MGSHDMKAIAAVKPTRREIARCDLPQYHVYLDVFGGWRWEFCGADGNFADCRESYDSRAECIAAARAAALTSLIDEIPKSAMPMA